MPLRVNLLYLVIPHGDAVGSSLGRSFSSLSSSSAVISTNVLKYIEKSRRNARVNRDFRTPQDIDISGASVRLVSRSRDSRLINRSGVISPPGGGELFSRQKGTREQKTDDLRPARDPFRS